MKIEKTILLTYLILGVSFGFVSDYFIKTFKDLTYALVIPVLVYFLTQYLLMKLVKEKKKRWLFYNSFLTFILIWLLIWILLFNL